MTKFLPRVSSFAALALSSITNARAADGFDVVVYGGTPAGLAAGIVAAREGASVIVIEPTKWIGGMVTGGLTRSDVGKQETVGGFAREFFARAAASKPGTPMWYAEPHVNLATFEAMVREVPQGGIQIVKEQRLKSVAVEGARIKSITTADGKTYAGNMFVDATYEGDLMARADVSYIVGRESRDQYGEPLAGFYPMPVRPHDAEVMAGVCSCLGGKGPHYIHGTPAKIPARDDSGKLLFGVTEASAAPGSADTLSQAYNFRVVVTRRTDIRVPFPKPAKYDPSRYELLLRLIKAYPSVRFGRLFHLGAVANGKYDLNAQGLFSTDYPGGNTAYPDGDDATRDTIWQDHADYIQGMLWFLGHDPRVSRELRDETNEWGLCRDEFADNDHWPYALYVREARRMIGEYVMIQKDCQTDIIKPDSVGMGSFVIDCHIVQRIVAGDGTVTDEGSFPDAPARPYQIAYRSLAPKKAECENLLVPVCFSASHVAYCSMRMEPVYMAMGHASGLAAMMAIKHRKSVQEIDVPALQAKLREQKAVLELKSLE
ncbi:MAG: FAD-dependent oxidoreductase, partial [Verrucomicrobiota bacterium]|nr:FAD-dependent oxidoreductase [Verrucomicrobiota bacterium]